MRSKADLDEDEPGEEGNGETTLKTSRFVSVSLRPDDPFAKRMLAIPVTTNNVLLKVTVPKRTGRKRKRGSEGSFLAEHEIDTNGADKAKAVSPNNPYVKAATVFRSLQDNATKYTVAPVGVIDEAHRVRGMLYDFYHVFNH